MLLSLRPSLRFHLLRTFVLVFVAHCVGVASLPAQVISSAEPHAFQTQLGESSSASDIAYQSDLAKLTERLDRLEAENQQLRAAILDREASSGNQVSAAPTRNLPRDSAGLDWLSEPDVVFDSETPGVTCTDSGEVICEGAPNLCGQCLQSLGWNKKGGWQIVPFGRLRGEVIYSSAAYTNDAVIVFLNPTNPFVKEDSTSIHGKQSNVGLRISGPPIQGWNSSGVILMNFMGAQPLRNFSGANIVLAYGELSNDRWSYRFGRMLDLFGPLNPSTVNQIQQRGAGNIGIYRGAINIDRLMTFSDAHRWKWSGRISQPDIPDYAAIPAIRGQNNGWPNIETRLGVELGEMQDYGRPIEFGFSGVLGETQAVLDPIFNGIITPGIDEVSQTRGLCLDGQLQGATIGARGEVWWAQAAGTYFAATLQSINPQTDQKIESIGGWGEIYVNLTSQLTTHVGYGIDDPRNGGLGFIDPNGVGQISYNHVGWWNMIYNVTDSFEIGVELSHRKTGFIDPTAANDGFTTHFSSTLNF